MEIPRGIHTHKQSKFSNQTHLDKASDLIKIKMCSISETIQSCLCESIKLIYKLVKSTVWTKYSTLQRILLNLTNSQCVYVYGCNN